MSQTLIFSSLYFPPNDVNFYISNYLIFPTIWYFQLCDISNYLIDQNSKLEISKVYNIGLQRYTWILKSEFIAKKNSVPMKAKKLSFCHKFKFSNPYIIKTWWCKPLICLTLTIWSTRIAWNIKGLQHRIAKIYLDYKIRVCGKKTLILWWQIS